MKSVVVILLFCGQVTFASGGQSGGAEGALTAKFQEMKRAETEVPPKAEAERRAVEVVPQRQQEAAFSKTTLGNAEATVANVRQATEAARAEAAAALAAASNSGFSNPMGDNTNHEGGSQEAQERYRQAKAKLDRLEDQLKDAEGRLGEAKTRLATAEGELRKAQAEEQKTKLEHEQAKQKAEETKKTFEKAVETAKVACESARSKAMDICDKAKAVANSMNIEAQRIGDLMGSKKMSCLDANRAELVSAARAAKKDGGEAILSANSCEQESEQTGKLCEIQNPADGSRIGEKFKPTIVRSQVQSDAGRIAEMSERSLRATSEAYGTCDDNKLEAQAEKDAELTDKCLDGEIKCNISRSADGGLIFSDSQGLQTTVTASQLQSMSVSTREVSGRTFIVDNSQPNRLGAEVTSYWAAPSYQAQTVAAPTIAAPAVTAPAVVAPTYQPPPYPQAPAAVPAPRDAAAPKASAAAPPTGGSGTGAPSNDSTKKDLAKTNAQGQGAGGLPALPSSGSPNSPPAAAAEVKPPLPPPTTECPSAQRSPDGTCRRASEVTAVDKGGEPSSNVGSTVAPTSKLEKIKSLFSSLLGGSKTESTAVAAQRGGAGIDTGRGTTGPGGKGAATGKLADAPTGGGAQGFMAAVGRALGLGGKGAAAAGKGAKGNPVAAKPEFKLPTFGQNEVTNYDRFLPKMGPNGIRRTAGVQGHPEIAGRHEDLFQNINRAYRNNAPMLSTGGFKTALRY